MKLEDIERLIEDPRTTEWPLTKRTCSKLLSIAKAGKALHAAIGPHAERTWAPYHYELFKAISDLEASAEGAADETP